MVDRPLFIEKHLSKSMMFLALWAGLFGFAVQFNDSVRHLAIVLALVVVCCLVLTSRKYFDEREQQLLSQSFSLAFQWLAAALLAAYAFLQLTERLNLSSSAAAFLNTHWIGLTVSLMGLLLGAAGLYLFRE